MWRIVQRWLNTGTSEELGFIVNTRIRTINLASTAGGLAALVFTILNISTGHYLLGVHTLANFLLLCCLIYFNARHNFTKGPVMVMALLSLLFCSNSILFNNAMEFYVLLVVCLGLVLFDNLRIITLILVVSSIMFLVTHKLAPRMAVEPVTEGRQFINMVIWLFILLLCLYYFKKQSLQYLRQVEIANEELKASNHSKEKLFSIVAHDMRSPLNSLTGTLDLLDNRFIDEQTFRNLSGLLSNQTKHLNENMDVLLKWANSQLRGIEVHPQLIDLCLYIQQVVTLLTPLMHFKQITCKIACEGPVMVYADTDHLQVILRNLLTNAIKFSYPQGIVFISTSIGNGNEVWIHVKDEGTGMTPETAQRLFEPNRIHSAPGTQNEKGIGLGLQLSKEFVQRNGGSLTVESLPGQGSTFSFSLPAAH